LGKYIKRINGKSILSSAILLIALSLRIWGVSYDLPYIYHPDEPWPIRIGHQMLITGDLNPHFFDWPSLVIYVNLFVQAIYYSLEKILSLGKSVVTNPLVELTMGVTYSPEPIVVLLGRLVTVGIGVGTVAVTMSMGKQLSRDLRVGLLAGIMIAASPTNVSLNRFITPDSYATFFITLTGLASIFIFQQGKTWAYIIAGICLGLAVSSKYNSGLIVIMFLAGHFLRTGLSGYKDYRLYLALFLGGLAFVAVTPYALLDFPEFYAGFLSTGKHYSTGHPGMDGNTLNWYLDYMWQTGGIIYALAILEIMHGIYSRSKKTILLSIFPVLYFVFISCFIVRNDRTFLPVTPFLFLLASLLLTDLWNKANKLQPKVVRLLSIWGIVCLFIIGLSLLTFKTVANTIRLTTVNSRETARIWIDNNLQTGDHIAIESYTPFVDPIHFSVQGFTKIIDHEPEWYIDQGFDYLVFGQNMYGRFYTEPGRFKNEVSQYDRLFKQFKLVKTFIDGDYEVRIYKVK
jgi:4-amino-4-deoxy-L-arabinose transferase-like glycosyltransferase